MQGPTLFQRRLKLKLKRRPPLCVGPQPNDVPNWHLPIHRYGYSNTIKAGVAYLVGVGIYNICVCAYGGGGLWGALAYSCWYLPEWLLVLFYFVTISAATAGNNKNANKSLDFPIEVFLPPPPCHLLLFVCVCGCCWCYCLLLPVSVLLVSLGMLFRGTVGHLGAVKPATRIKILSNKKWFSSIKEKYTIKMYS